MTSSRRFASASNVGSDARPADSRLRASRTRPRRVFETVVLGGGEAGGAVLAALNDAHHLLSTALIEPASYAYAQPNWVRVGTEGLRKEQTRTPQRFLIPPGVTWIRDRAIHIDPDERIVTTAQGIDVQYEHLVVTTGIEVRWDRIRGLAGQLGKHGLCSVYGYEHAEKTWEMLRTFEGGRALFTAPSSPYKGGVAPLSVLHRADALWRDTGVRDRTEMYFTTAVEPAYGGGDYTHLVANDADDTRVHVYSGYELIEVRPERREAVFRVAKDRAESRDILPYDLLHVVPPMRPPEIVESSRLSYQVGPLKGFLAVNPDTLRHKQFPTVYGAGDVIGVETVKTGDRARQQAATIAARIYADP